VQQRSATKTRPKGVLAADKDFAGMKNYKMWQMARGQ
jgi:hypothetical protein